ncbi:MAG: Lrp/AsnC family transcriptional regulator [Proteobacteria bacterium]|nr:MAG: Lrp/AsnC family transcriptional regulator [Pseudomonadota bacterium]QKK11243.1 MAG: Lrp/AsnC family transcriptional regulator [Pseudomonadota bacterium]
MAAVLQPQPKESATVDFTALERRLLDEFQQEFPLSPRPFAEMAERLGVSEAEVVETLKSLKERGALSRVGPVFRPKRVGASTLAAMAVPPEYLEEVAGLVSALPEVNHNYEREHRFNLWFVVTAEDAAHLEAVLDGIAEETGIPVLPLPMEEDFHIDLGFRLKW